MWLLATLIVVLGMLALDISLTASVASHAISIPIAVKISTQPVPLQHVCILYTKLTLLWLLFSFSRSVYFGAFYQCFNVK